MAEESLRLPGASFLTLSAQTRIGISTRRMHSTHVHSSSNSLMWKGCGQAQTSSSSRSSVLPCASCLDSGKKQRREAHQLRSWAGAFRIARAGLLRCCIARRESQQKARLLPLLQFTSLPESKRPGSSFTVLQTLFSRPCQSGAHQKRWLRSARLCAIVLT